MRCVIAIVLVSFFSTLSIFAQTIEKNDNGDSIIVYPDGSWRYFDANNSNDQQLLQNFLNESKSSKDLNPTPQPFEVFTENASTTQTSTNAFELASKAITEEKEAALDLSKASSKVSTLKANLKRLKKSDFSTESQLQVAKAKLEKAKREEILAKEKLNLASKKAKSYEKIALLPPEKQAAAMAQLNGSSTPKPVETEEKLATTEVNNSPKKTKIKSQKKPKSSTPNTKKTKIKKEKTTIKPTEKVAVVKQPTKELKASSDLPTFGKTADTFTRLRPEDDAMLFPPTPDCTVAFEGVDEFSGKKRKDIAPSLFFTYTNENLRSLFKDKDMIECTGHLSNVSGGLKFLSLEIVIHDEKAQQNYGILEKGSLFSIRLVDGTTVQLINKKTNQGTINRFEEHITYTTKYLISPNQEKALQKMEIDKVRLVWSTGYEEYDIYETDFLIHQLNCLNQ